MGTMFLGIGSQTLHHINPQLQPNLKNYTMLQVNQMCLNYLANSFIINENQSFYKMLPRVFDMGYYFLIYNINGFTDLSKHSTSLLQIRENIQNLLLLDGEPGAHISLSPSLYGSSLLVVSNHKNMATTNKSKYLQTRYELCWPYCLNLPNMDTYRSSLYSVLHLIKTLQVFTSLLHVKQNV